MKDWKARLQDWNPEDLPAPTTDLARCRRDIETWGYCLLRDALDPSLLGRLRERLLDQARAELEGGLAFEDGGPDQQWGAFRDADGRIRPEAFTAAAGGVNQRVWMLVNKGAVFLEALESTPAVHELVGHVLGEEYLLSSYTANIAKPGGVKMDLHTDQWWAPAPTRPGRRPLPVGSMSRTRFDRDEEAPATMIAAPAASNVLFMLNAFDARNGGTCVVPGSHLAPRHPDPVLDADVPVVQAEGPAGTALITDGRVWHGTGANRSNADRIALITTYCGPQFRPQENFTVGTRPEVLRDASPWIKTLLGLKVWWAYGRTGQPTVEFIDPRAPIVGELAPESAP